MKPNKNDSKNLKENIDSFLKKSLISAATIASSLGTINAQEAKLLVKEKDNQNKLLRIEAIKSNNVISSYIKNNDFIKAFEYTQEKEPTKYHHDDIYDSPDNLTILRNEIIEAYSESIGRTSDDLSMLDVPVEFTQNYIKNSPDYDAYTDYQTKNNSYLGRKNEDGTLPSISESIKNAKFTLDTISTKEPQAAFGYYFMAEKMIKLNTIEANSAKNTEKLIKHNESISKLSETNNLDMYLKRILAHELFHKNQDEKNFHRYHYSTENGSYKPSLTFNDYDKMEQLLEITPEVNAMLLFSEEYVKTGKIDKECYAQFPEYAKAIENGEINPKDLSDKSKDKEFKKMFEVATNDWQNKRKFEYSSISKERVSRYFDYHIGLSEKSKGNVKIREESAPLILNMKIQELSTFKYAGKEINLFPYANEIFKKLSPYEETVKDYSNMSSYMKEVNAHYKNEIKIKDKALTNIMKESSQKF